MLYSSKSTVDDWYPRLPANGFPCVWFWRRRRYRRRLSRRYVVENWPLKESQSISPRRHPREKRRNTHKTICVKFVFPKTFGVDNDVSCTPVFNEFGKSNRIHLGASHCRLKKKLLPCVKSSLRQSPLPLGCEYD